MNPTSESRKVARPVHYQVRGLSQTNYHNIMEITRRVQRNTVLLEDCTCMLKTIHTGFPGSILNREAREHSRRPKCLPFINIKTLKSANGWYRKSEERINNNPVWKNHVGRLMWTNHIFGPGYIQTSGWVIIVNNRIRAYNPKSTNCPSDNWQYLAPRMQRRFRNVISRAGRDLPGSM